MFYVFFIVNVVIMAVGYFLNYSKTAFTIYIFLLLIVGTSYCVYGRNRYTVSQNLYYWLIIFMLFPAKPLTPIIRGLLNDGLGIQNVSIAFKDIVEVFMLTTLFLSVKRQYNKKTKLFFHKRELGLLNSLKLFILIGFVGIIFSKVVYADIANLNYYQMFEAIKPFIGGYIVLKSFRFLSGYSDVERLLKVFIITGLVIILEYSLLTYFGDFLPYYVKYYIIDWRGGLRSILFSGSLNIGFALILVVGTSIYFFKKSYNVGHLLLAVLSIILTAQTYERSIVFATIVIAIMLVFHLSITLRWMVYVMVVTVFIGLTFGRFDADEVNKTVTAYLDPDNVKGKEYLATGTLLDRLGASARSLDIFLFNPVFGSGPGNTIALISSTDIPTLMPYSSLPDISRNMYSMIKSGFHPTDAHNLPIKLISEYGFIGLLCVTYFIFVIINRYIKFIIKDNNRLKETKSYQLSALAYSIVFGMMFYYMVQANPLNIEIMAFFTGLIFFKRQHVNQVRPI